MRQRVGRTVLTMVVAGVVAGAGVAWACTASANLTVAPGRAPAGGQVTVSGSQFSDGRVEVRFGSAEGTLLGEASGHSFSLAVRLPEAAPGPNYITAIGYDSKNEVAGRATAPIEITGTATASQTPELDVSEPQSPNQPEASVVGGEPVEAAPVPSKSASTRAQRTPRTATETPLVAVPAAGAATSARPGSSAGAAPEPSPAKASARTAGADLWSGFTGGPETLRGPSLADRPLPVSSGGGVGLGVLVLVGSALVTLVGAIAIPARTRVKASRR